MGNNQIEQLKSGDVLFLKNNQVDENTKYSNNIEQLFNKKTLNLSSKGGEIIPLDRIYHLCRASRTSDIFYIIAGSWSDTYKYLVKGNFSTQKWSDYKSVTLPTESRSKGFFHCIGSSLYTSQESGGITTAQRRLISTPEIIEASSVMQKDTILSTNQSDIYSGLFVTTHPYGVGVKKLDVSDFSIISSYTESTDFATAATGYACDTSNGYLSYALSSPLVCHKIIYTLPYTKISDTFDSNQYRPFYADFGYIVANGGSAVCNDDFSFIKYLNLIMSGGGRYVAAMCPNFCGILEGDIYSWKIFIYENYDWNSPTYLKCPSSVGASNFEFVSEGYPRY